MQMKSSLKPFLTALAILVAGGASADTAADQRALLRLFADSCLKTYPTHSGINEIMAGKGFEKTDYDAWVGDDSFVNPAVKHSGGTSCFVSRQKTDPRSIHSILVNALSQAGAKDIKATVRGRKTDITLTLKGISTRVRAGPMSNGVASVAKIVIFQQ